MNIQCYKIIVISALLGGCAMDGNSDDYRKLDVVRHVDLENQRETIVARSDGQQYKAWVTLRGFNKSDCQDHYHWYGTDVGLPDYVVDEIYLERDGIEMNIPSRIYADFGDISFEAQQTKLRLSTNKKKVLLEYSGSDGAGSYYTEFYFDNDTFSFARIRGGARHVERR